MYAGDIKPKSDMRIMSRKKQKTYPTLLPSLRYMYVCNKMKNYLPNIKSLIWKTLLQMMCRLETYRLKIPGSLNVFTLTFLVPELQYTPMRALGIPYL